MARPSTAKAGGIGTDAVAKRTGRTWDQWFRLLDRSGARKWTHKQIAAHLGESHGIGAWWAQMVTVGYEQACQGREKHQKPDGYEVSVSKTIHVPVSRLYRAWVDRRSRRRWLPDGGFEIRRANKDQSLRITWIDGKTYVDVQFTGKSEQKSQVVVQHRKLATSAAAAKAKKAWATSLVSLKDCLES